MTTACLIAACAAVVAPIPNPSAPRLVVDAHVDLVSDYSWRGVSLSNGRPAVQGGIDMAHASGLYVSAWASSLPRSLGSAEIDLGAGWSREVGDVTVSVGALAYLYPSLSRADYVEVVGAVGRDIAGIDVSLAAAYAPDQANLARDDLYLSADARVPVGETGVSLTSHLGRERGPFNRTRTKYDWSAGLAYTHETVTLSAAYIDTDEPSALDARDAFAPRLVASLSLSF